MPTDTFWQSMGFNGASAIGVTGIDTRPYARLSEGTSSMAQKVLDDAAVLFPEFDGVTNKAVPLPADFANPSFGSFLGWHTAHQVQFLKEQSPDWGSGDLRSVTFLQSADLPQNQTFLLSADGRKVYHVNKLQGTDIAQMPLADQERLADLPTFRELIANPQGWWPADGYPGGATPPATVAAARDAIETRILGPFEQIVRASSAFDANRRTEVITASNLAELYPNLFLDQLGLIRARLATMAVFDPNALGLMVKELSERFTRLERFANITKPEPDPLTGLTLVANSTDGLAGAQRALKVFLQSELRLRDLFDASTRIGLTGEYNDRAVDSPQLVFLFQTQQNYLAEADAQAKSEELKEMKALVENYTKIQKILNTTMQKFDPVKFGAVPGRKETDEEKLGLLGYSLADSAGQRLSDDEKIVVSMFNTASAKAKANSFHPIEKETSSTRPTFDMVGNFGTFVVHSQTEWDLFSQSLSKVSKVLSADSQSRMDEINRISRGKNRNYDLASETLNKMTDILRSIVN